MFDLVFHACPVSLALLVSSPLISFDFFQSVPKQRLEDLVPGICPWIHTTFLSAPFHGSERRIIPRGPPTARNPL